jgi:NitT/TauT family transport system ATP-binding protein
MRQRVNLARAFANDPDILLMDEPFAALDVQNRSLMQESLLQLWSAEQRTVVFVTHGIDEALILADRVLIMSSAPSTIIAEYDVPFARPRNAEELRYSKEFVELDREISAIVREQVIKAEGVI